MRMDCRVSVAVGVCRLLCLDDGKPQVGGQMGRGGDVARLLVLLLLVLMAVVIES